MKVDEVWFQTGQEQWTTGIGDRGQGTGDHLIADIPCSAEGDWAGWEKVSNHSARPALSVNFEGPGLVTTPGAVKSDSNQ